ncbi:hypothetical protein SAMN06296386_1046 [Lachnospiraceae bacterium]|nr:hypothetical protein SAMN06296386_1046 [Lachnospiraceae bacterium]
MTDIPVLLNDKDQIEKFVQINSSLECQVDVSDGRISINGKSIIGLLSLSLFDPLHVSLIGENINVSKVVSAYKKYNLIA